MSGSPRRILPEVTARNQHFWTGGADGQLRFLRCAGPGCGHLVHPPAPVCPRCLGRLLAPAAVSGRGRVFSFTVNHQPWAPGDPVPYVIAIVELDEQVGLRLTTNIVGCAPDAVRIGMPVQVRFEEVDGVHLPLFEPVP